MKTKIYRIRGPRGRLISIIGPSRSHLPRAIVEQVQIDLSHIGSYEITHGTSLPQPYGRSLRAAFYGPDMKYAQRVKGSERDFSRDCFERKRPPRNPRKR